MKRLLLSLLFATVTLAAFSQKRLHTGWYSVKKLQRMGYTVPANSPKRIYVRGTADLAKVNIYKP